MTETVLAPPAKTEREKPIEVEYLGDAFLLSPDDFAEFQRLMKIIAVAEKVGDVSWPRDLHHKIRRLVGSSGSWNAR